MRMRVMDLMIFVSFYFILISSGIVGVLTLVLAFGENLVLTAHPSKSGGDWWYGTLLTSGRSGLFPKTFVQTFQPSACC